jgi:hypothetical protein
MSLFSFLYTTGGVVGVITNLIIIFIILTVKEARSQHRNFALLALANGLIALQIFSAFGVPMTPNIVPIWVCALNWRPLSFLLGTLWASVLVNLMSFERLSAIYRPAWHLKNWERFPCMAARYAVFSFFAILAPVAIVLTTVITGWSRDDQQCSVDVYAPFLNLIGLTNMFSYLVSMLVNFVTCGIAHWRVEEGGALQKEIAKLHVITAVSVVAVLLISIPGLCAMYIPQYTNTLIYVNLLTPLYCSLDLVIYLAMWQKFRYYVRLAFFCRQSAVQSNRVFAISVQPQIK